MRVGLAVLASATILLVGNNLVESASHEKLTEVSGPYFDNTVETTSDNKRILRGVDSKNGEERKAFSINNDVPIVVRRWRRVSRPTNQVTLQNMDQILKLKELDAALDPKKADKLIKAGYLGWLGKKDLTMALSTNMKVKIRVFAKWRKEGRTPAVVTELIKKDPAIEKKYRFVYVAYEGWVKKEQAKRITGKKRKRGRTRGE
ncbi:RxLR effector protein [Phytophthora megakarya]|uniref:RxLR effector protein n=1 Tax=Phytophthora megakarya TaxID=4795 RepID=A0A225V9L8_9STRA|nr:RxLR effector protein [Phytophthora megakarya]